MTDINWELPLDMVFAGIFCTVIGGIFYEVSWLSLPIVIIGIILLFSAPLIYLFAPLSKSSSSSDNKKQGSEQ